MTPARAHQITRMKHTTSRTRRREMGAAGAALEAGTYMPAFRVLPKCLHAVRCEFEGRASGHILPDFDWHRRARTCCNFGVASECNRPYDDPLSVPRRPPFSRPPSDEQSIREENFAGARTTWNSRETSSCGCAPPEIEQPGTPRRMCGETPSTHRSDKAPK